LANILEDEPADSMKELDIRRHAEREKDADALTAAGRARAEDVGRGLPTDYAVVFVSPAKRAAETLAWFLRGSGQGLPDHAVVRGLASEVEDRWRAAAKAAGTGRIDAVTREDPSLVAEESAHLAHVVQSMFDRVPPGGRGLAVGHTPLIEAAVYGLLGLAVEPLGECEGVHLTQEDSGGYRLQEIRLPPAGAG
jgi:broad specificity phosphatase PhoE